MRSSRSSLSQIIGGWPLHGFGTAPYLRGVEVAVMRALPWLPRERRVPAGSAPSGRAHAGCVWSMFARVEVMRVLEHQNAKPKQQDEQSHEVSNPAERP